MYKTVEWSLSERQRKGIVKMTSILVNMLQDHSIDDLFLIKGKEVRIRAMMEVLSSMVTRMSYDEYEKEYLNEVRNLVLQYQGGELHNTHTTWEQYHPYDMSFLTTMSNASA
jgi:pyruvate/2-oxoglutarate dehydrogenase complex dihydrolipoamide acyltransferase (E2) component